MAVVSLSAAFFSLGNTPVCFAGACIALLTLFTYVYISIYPHINSGKEKKRKVVLFVDLKPRMRQAIPQQVTAYGK